MSKASRFTNGIIVRDGRPSSPSGDLNETKLTQLRVISLSLTPASVGAATVAAQNLTLTGSSASDNFVVCIANPIANATGIVGVVKSTTDVISVSFVNPTAGALTPTSGTYVFLVGRYSNT